MDPHHSRAAIYPPAEMVQRRSGEAKIGCTITETVDAENCRVLSATAPDFGLAGLYAVLASKFLPAYRNGQPVSIPWEKTFSFHVSPHTDVPVLDKNHTRLPIYPASIEKGNIQGKINVTCEIDQTGVAHDCTSQDVPEPLRVVAIAYFTQARYYPALRNGSPVTAPFHGSINWSAAHPDDQDGFR
ncbi:hypothetical protein GMO_20940 [Gluconobacter morbifer G707]|uniref:TonB C-terminal domain-containing protein n=2 Tax=Gluconobacter TaxID=441 RepID=G6XKS8_9PROT|nr:hypothetical protein GMO_20940 [Gluconobacter morbifer G707]